jgi:RES domain-containing protein
MPVAYRLLKTRFAHEPLSSEGARLYGGRWNSPGTAVVYLAESTGLALVEGLVHLDERALLASYALVKVTFPTSKLRTLSPKELPSGWDGLPAPTATQVLGDAWARRGAELALRVPSAIVPEAYCYVLNPTHPEFGKIVADPPVPFRFDPRLLGPRHTHA